MYRLCIQYNNNSNIVSIISYTFKPFVFVLLYAPKGYFPSMFCVQYVLCSMYAIYSYLRDLRWHFIF